VFAAQPAWTSLPGRLTSSRAEHVTAAGGFTSASGPSGRRSALPGRAITGNDPASLDHLVGAAKHLVNNPPW